MTAPPFRGWSWVPAAMLRCYRAPPRVCSKEGGEAVPRTPWLGYGIQPVSGPLTPCTEGKTPVDAPFREPMHRQRRFVYQNIRNQQGFIFILFPSIFMLPF